MKFWRLTIFMYSMAILRIWTVLNAFLQWNWTYFRIMHSNGILKLLTLNMFVCSLAINFENLVRVLKYVHATSLCSPPMAGVIVISEACSVLLLLVQTLLNLVSRMLLHECDGIWENPPYVLLQIPSKLRFY